jgi:hypothetical protein
MIFERGGLLRKFRPAVVEHWLTVKKKSMHEMATAARHSDVLKNIPAGRSASFILEHRL